MKAVFLCISTFLAISSFLNAQLVTVSSSTQLQNALNTATAGTTIQVQPGVYTRSGGFSAPINVDGTSASPITVEGIGEVVLSTGTLTSSYGFWLTGNKYWVLKNFSIRNCKKGLIIDSSFHNVVENVTVKYIGEEGIHIRTYSSYNTVRNCYLDSIGMVIPDIGEGIYIGSAESNWCTYTNCNMDTCNYNQVLNNSFGNYVRAENIDLKEGTKGGIIRGNIMNGTGLANLNGGDSWIDVKGNSYIIEFNTGTNSYLDGIQTHIRYPGFGNFNIFRQNTFYVDAPGYGINIQTSSSLGSANGNIVCNNNVVTGAGAGYSNVATQSCAAVVLSTSFNWYISELSSVYAITYTLQNAVEVTEVEIQQSSDGVNFTSLYPFTSISGQGSVQLQKSQVKGNFVRVRLLYTNGTKVYSNTVRLNNKGNAVNIKQLGNYLEITNADTNFKLAFYDMSGRLTEVKDIFRGNTRFALDSRLKGIYLVNLLGPQGLRVVSCPILL